MKESTLQQQCIEYLTIIASVSDHDIFFFAPLNETAMMILRRFSIPNNIAARIISFLKKMGMVPGTPDLQICYCGTSIFVELKVPGKYPDERQKRIHEKIRSTGHRVEVARSIDDFKQILRFCGVVR